MLSFEITQIVWKMEHVGCIMVINTKISYTTHTQTCYPTNDF